MGYPVPFDRYLLFNSPVSVLIISTHWICNPGERYQVTSAKQWPTTCRIPDGKTLYYNKSGKDGMDVVRTEFNPLAWKKFITPAPSANNMYDHLVERRGILLYSRRLREQFPVSRYHRAQGMINPHSWGPYFINSLTQAQCRYRVQ